MTQRQGTSRWRAPRAHEAVHGTVEVPGSKSVTNRALVLAALASGPSTLVSPLRSRDTVLMVDALRALGTGIDDATGDAWQVVPAPVRGQATVDCGLSGTVMRFVPPLAALGTGRVDFDGDPEARGRPMRTVLDALRGLGVDVTGTSLPFHLEGSGAVRGGTVTIDASASSQFVSGLLLSGARYDGGLTVCHDGGAVPSSPHITMTLDMLASAGVAVTSTGDDRRWRVEPGPVGGREWVIDPDLSNATPFLAAAAVTGGTVTVPGWPERTTQAGDAIRSILAGMGADVSLTGGALTVGGPERLTGIDVDLREAGELAPTVAALATLAAGPSRLRGVAHLRGHETDRLAALVAEITALGGDAEETADGIDIRPAPLHGGTWHAYADHRMATAGAIIGLVVDDVSVDDIACTGKTLPGFTVKWRAMLAGMPAEA